MIVSQPPFVHQFDHLGVAQAFTLLASCGITDIKMEIDEVEFIGTGNKAYERGRHILFKGNTVFSIGK